MQSCIKKENLPKLMLPLFMLGSKAKRNQWKRGGAIV